MCGRFGLTADSATLRARYRLATDDSVEELKTMKDHLERLNQLGIEAITD